MADKKTYAVTHEVTRGNVQHIEAESREQAIAQAEENIDVEERKQISFSSAFLSRRVEAE